MASKRVRVITIFGTRPEAIKMAPVVKELASRKESFESLVCVTTQHREMLRQVLEVFEIHPDHDLDTMIANQDLFDITGRVLSGMKRVLDEVKPDVALVHGDTTTTFAAALACFYRSVPVGHVEAGLRTKDKRQPFPEEINRRLADQICDIHYAPTTVNEKTLLGEGAPAEGIVITGNTVIDALLSILPKARAANPQLAGLEHVDWKQRMILVTCHRRESFGEQLEGIIRAFKTIVEQHPDACIVYPVHRNPNVLGPVTKMLTGVPRVHLIDPVEYLPFVWLMDRSHIILTDSGGIQEEAPSLDKPVLVMRNKTERGEAIETGAVRLVGTTPQRIIDEVGKLLTDPADYRKMASARNPYGDGHAAGRIADDLIKRLGQKPA
jgi:UDP-N-acetylglucosamine 2-epimerase (non-hydrolysing)